VVPALESTKSMTVIQKKEVENECQEGFIHRFSDDVNQMMR
jgi:hypothetical protein